VQYKEFFVFEALSACFFRSTALLAGAAQAQWCNLHEDANQATYTERGEIVRTDTLVNVAEMLDYKQKMRDQKGLVFHSVLIRAQYNCRDNRVRSYTIDFHEARMAGGQVVKLKRSTASGSRSIPGVLSKI